MGSTSVAAEAPGQSRVGVRPSAVASGGVELHHAHGGRAETNGAVGSYAIADDGTRVYYAPLDGCKVHDAPQRPGARSRVVRPAAVHRAVGIPLSLALATACSLLGSPRPLSVAKPRRRSAGAAAIPS
jgi:hypothetical protein